jgi:hypothetical protein
MDQLFPRICILLPNKVQDLNEESASDTFGSINQLHQALLLLENEQYQTGWTETLNQIAQLDQANALIKGNCLRLLLIRQDITDKHLFRLTRYNLSSLHDPFYPCYFLEGLLFGGGWLLIHNPSLRLIIDQWMSGLDQEIFLGYLPIMRRTFSTFSVEEKEAIYQLLFSNKFIEKEVIDIDEKRKQLIIGGVRKFFQDSGVQF